MSLILGTLIRNLKMIVQISPPIKTTSTGRNNQFKALWNIDWILTSNFLKIFMRGSRSSRKMIISSLISLFLSEKTIIIECTRWWSQKWSITSPYARTMWPQSLVVLKLMVINLLSAWSNVVIKWLWYQISITTAERALDTWQTVLKCITCQFCLWLMVQLDSARIWMAYQS